jgi:hypothetical protein
MQKSNFREWTLDKVDECFGLTQVGSLPILEELLAFQYEINDFEKSYLSILREDYVAFGGDDWNEVELENKMISPIIIFSRIQNKEFSYFLERDLAITIDEYELSGRVDGIIATGFRNPKKPFFCMSEYKRGTDPNGDPKGQALIAMLAAQQLNENKKPIYGSFIIGRTWYFMALVGKEYAISGDYSCADDEIFDIFRILKSLRVQIQKLI